MMIMSKEFDLMEKAIQTGRKREAKEIIEFVEAERAKRGHDYYADYFIMQELLNKLRREIS